jgi:hypothetical protein
MVHWDRVKVPEAILGSQWCRVPGTDTQPLIPGPPATARGSAADADRTAARGFKGWPAGTVSNPRRSSRQQVSRPKTQSWSLAFRTRAMGEQSLTWNV